MCGIVGLSLASPHPLAPRVVAAMTEALHHRGPDSSGSYATADGATHLGFRRLAIRDLNPRSNQPMISASGRSVLVFNGEVYNSAELAKRLLPDMPLRTTGDAEVVLETLERHGPGVLNQFNGMFALALVDVRSGRLLLSRDRMGKKPLYVHAGKKLLAFASELRCLKPFGLRVDPSRSELFLQFGYFPAPHTFFQDTFQVCPGEIVEIDCGCIVRRRRYHHFANELWSHDLADLDQLDELLAASVQLRLLSDVPLGAFLSGGVDSALMSAYLAGQGDRPATSNAASPPTFTVTFADRAHDESRGAADTARALGLTHRVIEIEEQNLADLAHEFLDCYEQPYADTSGLATLLLCRAVKEHVTVALSGDGGDEFFGGYMRYRWFQWALRARHAPRLLRLLAGQCASRIDRRRGDRLARWLAARDPAGLYSEILRNWTATDFDQLVPGHGAGESAAAALVRDVFAATPADPLAQAACFDAAYYIPDDLQVKLDRASMRFALEVRCPLLDYRVARLGAGIRSRFKFSNGLKSPLKALLDRYAPHEVARRPKHGFSVPLARWLRGPLRPLVEDSLAARATHEVGWLSTDVARRVWTEFLRGRTRHAHGVWMILNLAHHARDQQAHPDFRSLAAGASRKAA